MFIFRSRRSQLLTRLWTLDNVEAGEQEESRRRITNLLKRLEVGQLERLVVAVETGQCCSLTGEDWLVQLRWPELTSQDGLIRLPTCPTSHCSNPQHWARLATPEIASSCAPSGLPVEQLPGYSSTSSQSSLDSSSTCLFSSSTISYLPPYQGDSSAPASSVATGGGNTAQDMEGVSWCRLAYWEERVRVGAQHFSVSPNVQIFSSPASSHPPPHCDSLSLADLMSSNLRASQSTLRTRDKIGRGVLLSRDEVGVWAHNRTEVPIFVNSPTLDIPNSRTFSVFKIPPGYSMQIFNFELSQVYKTVRDPAAYEGPYDPHAVRLSFAKGWGPGYSRQSVECCPCWLEILLNPSSL